jgi:hypothetical protein
MGVSGQLHVPTTLPPRHTDTHTPVPTEQEGGWASEPVGTIWITDKSFVGAMELTIFGSFRP